MATAGALLGMLVVAGGSLAWHIAGASATSGGRADVETASLVAEQVTTTSSSTSTSTSTTVKPTTTTMKPTTTTVKPKPIPTTAATPRTTVPKPPPAPAAAAPDSFTPPVAQPSGTTAEVRCNDAKQWVIAHGLTLPAGWGFRCPGQALVDGALRWGVACWNCEGNGASWIAVDIGRIGSSDAALRYVIAHETCHAIDYMGLGITSELAADTCAALHGAPRP